MNRSGNTQTELFTICLAHVHSPNRFATEMLEMKVHLNSARIWALYPGIPEPRAHGGSLQGCAAVPRENLPYVLLSQT
jgi:hypothetical protein